MNFIKNHIAYLKDNPNHLWFKRKLYGWGWTPVTWQGWVIILVFIIIVVANYYRIDASSPSESETLMNFIPQTIFLAALLMILCYKKGEEPKWQWGFKKDKK
ncbi:hypothetical protein A2738_00400 [Candidatus Nomurabacteria bacterium RIFCSPHIGHO2_01_FULL_42_15]|uniref:Uncharacterized protein n=1 Tax=Candidatus Nomurabacteria bacterium RIFCSPHIGHO2_01_FULL_42_15 TaxID=1801742 RepID=A0A1F6VEF0_9BACT|nr:MAG: hypothetical protein A2738_00400 [Candidatus Nomurabacteria bacterium RIFCSPHIGHO2_01_FULL_42_15]OGI93275.1 MAG: hypothetical protein A3A99_03985 [Candidatus Nomurabacteria bacterium RIFCSPLOWO2_01_FULL_41_18]